MQETIIDVTPHAGPAEFCKCQLDFFSEGPHTYVDLRTHTHTLLCAHNRLLLLNCINMISYNVVVVVVVVCQCIGIVVSFIMLRIKLQLCVRQVDYCNKPEEKKSMKHKAICLLQENKKNKIK